MSESEGSRGLSSPSMPPNLPRKKLISQAFAKYDSVTSSNSSSRTTRNKRHRPRQYSGALPVGDQPIKARSGNENQRYPLLEGHFQGSFNEVQNSGKLGTYSGVFVPTILNVLSVLMFLRFGFVLGQAGFMAMTGLLITCYLINSLTTMSISAIATNGVVRGGGAYYLISRSLGPEFGGSIGLVFYLGLIFNTGMNIVGLVECFMPIFGSDSGTWSNWLPESYWWQYFSSTLILLVCTAMCLAGSSLFSKASNTLLVILLLATLSIPLSTLVQKPFFRAGIDYTGPQWQTFRENLFPFFTESPAGKGSNGKAEWNEMIGIMFPATGGIFAGASMSGDLKHPSKAIPKGTFWGLLSTFAFYEIVIATLACSVARASFHNNTNVIQVISVSQTLILAGEFSTAFFSALMGVISSAKLLQAIAKDDLFPGLSTFSIESGARKEPVRAIIFTYVITQVTMLFPVNKIASFVTMAYLMTFLVTNLACFLLKIGSAPNFRPSFRYFSWWTAIVGAVFSGLTMFIVDSTYAASCITLIVTIFTLIHYFSSPKSWGDVSQSLIYHQVRKYLLRLRQDHVKYWRPQILLLLNEPLRQYHLIQFCNSMKKGGLYVLGHVVITDNFAASVADSLNQQRAWAKYIDFSKIKAFVQVVVAPSIEWGVRNLILAAGLGGMKPNIVVLGAFNYVGWRTTKEPQTGIDATSSEAQKINSTDSIWKNEWRITAKAKLCNDLPEELYRAKKPVEPQHYMAMLEDILIHMRMNVAIAKGFAYLELPQSLPSPLEMLASLLNGQKSKKKPYDQQYIDLWPIQMSAHLATNDGDGDDENLITPNFDTYTLILQLGCILRTVKSWKAAYKLRIFVFVEYESEIGDESERVQALLCSLRIQADLVVLSLASGTLPTYEWIISGKKNHLSQPMLEKVETVLKDEDWWHKAKQIRSSHGTLTINEEQMKDSKNNSLVDPETILQPDLRPSPSVYRMKQCREYLRRRSTTSVSKFSRFGVSMGIQTHRLLPEMVNSHAIHDSGSEGHSSSQSEDNESSADESGYPITAASKGYGSTMSNYDLPPLRSRSTHSPTTSVEVKQRVRSPSRRLKALNSTPSGPPPWARSSRSKVQDPESSLIGPANVGEATRVPTRETVSTLQNPSSQFGHGYHRKSKSFQEDPKKPFGYQNHGQGSMGQASLDAASVVWPSSFGSLPRRAQNLILNELIHNNATQTAVLFTSLPAPAEGTCSRETDSVRYLEDIEILCEGLPPVLLVHSNSITVTTSL